MFIIINEKKNKFFKGFFRGLVSLPIQCYDHEQVPDVSARRSMLREGYNVPCEGMQADIPEKAVR